jgi:hypothetical protein
MLTNTNMKSGQIDVDSWIKAGRIFTAHSRLMTRKIGAVDEDTLAKVVAAIISIIDVKGP